MQKQQRSEQNTNMPWAALVFLSVFMLAGIGGGIAFFSDNQIGAGLLFMLMFCGISGLMMYLLLQGRKKMLQELAMLGGTKPVDGITSNNKAGYQSMLAAGSLLLVIGIAVSSMALVDELPKANYAVLLVLVFPLLGLLLLWQGRSKLRQWQRIGATPFFPDPFPGCAGGQIGGYFTLQRGRFTQLPLVELSCLHIYQTGSGKNRTTHRQPLWTEHCIVSRGADDQYWLVQDVPARLPATGEDPRYDGRIEWQLSCKGELQQGAERLEFNRQWTLPVIAGSANSSWQPSESEVVLQQQHRNAAAVTNAAKQIQQQRHGDTLYLTSRAGRHTGAATTLIICGIIFTAAGVFLGFEALENTAMLWLMALIFIPIGLLILLYGLFWLGRSLQASIAPGEVRMLRAMFGIRLYQRKAVLLDPQQLQIKQTMASTSGEGERTEYYRLQADTDGKTLVLAEGIIGRDAAEALKQQAAQILRQEE